MLRAFKIQFWAVSMVGLVAISFLFFWEHRSLIKKTSQFQTEMVSLALATELMEFFISQKPLRLARNYVLCSEKPFAISQPSSFLRTYQLSVVDIMQQVPRSELCVKASLQSELRPSDRFLITVDVKTSDKIFKLTSMTFDSKI